MQSIFPPSTQRVREAFGQAFVWPANEVPTNNGHLLVAVSTGGHPMTWGVQLQAVYSNVFNLADRPKLRAEVGWGVLGARNTAQIDVFKGASFNIVADNIAISIIDESFYALAPPTKSPFTVMASASPMPFDTTDPVTRTLIEPDPVAIGNRIQIPPFARTLSVMRFDANSLASNYSIVFRDYAGFKIGNVAVGAGGELENYLLAGDSNTVELETKGAGIGEFRYIFGLDL